ncbi:MAG: preprotein translocase subunit SecE [Rhodobacteraceae bacterium]|nr:MAG: preprotein translocase subunit SecE [Paracoccaceae bacterium]|tara:strand:+ start:1662 stop:1892 length:231 start_codon:yes stop_codon:yes gene_type:complete
MSVQIWQYFWSFTMANPLKYVQQVRNEVSKIVWPTRKETMTTTLMVFVMSAIVALFFFLIDTITSNILDIILKLAS